MKPTKRMINETEFLDLIGYCITEASSQRSVEEKNTRIATTLIHDLLGIYNDREYFQPRSWGYYKKMLEQQSLLKRIANEEFYFPEIFVSFMEKRFPNEKNEAYIRQWVDRFKSGNPKAYMDSVSRKVYDEVTVNNSLLTKKNWK